MKSGIYKIINNVTGKFYIGSAKDIEWRWYDHKHNLRAGTHCNPKLQHSWDFHGENKFSFIILEEVEPDQKKLFEREQYYLDTFKPYIRGEGYNISPTAGGGDNITYHPDRDAFVEKMRTISTGKNNPMFGRNHTPDAIKMQKDKAKGRFTLKWFIERYGQQEGQEKYNARRTMLKSRKINYSHASLTKGRNRMPMKEESKQKLTETKKQMKTLRSLLLQDISSDLYSMSQLSEKYGVGIHVIKYYKRKLKARENPQL